MGLFSSKRPHFEYLRKKWKARHRQVTDELFGKHLRRIAIGSLGGLLMLGSGGAPLPTSSGVVDQNIKITGSTNKNVLLAKELQTVVPEDMRPLTSEEEAKVADILSKEVGFKVAAEIDNKRLNRTYGMIGGEQHLYRYPGDTVYAHARNAQDWAMFGDAGIAPGLGAWGYFTPSKEQFSKEDDERERWYIAVQTFLSPGFAERVGEYRDFYKYRKMLVVNPKTGQAVVTDVGDAGPAEFTGKHLGGSPEVMHELGLASGPRKGAVLYYFLEDQSIPLGPVKLDSGQLAAVITKQ